MVNLNDIISAAQIRAIQSGISGALLNSYYENKSYTYSSLKKKYLFAKLPDCIPPSNILAHTGIYEAAEKEGLLLPLLRGVNNYNYVCPVCGLPLRFSIEGRRYRAGVTFKHYICIKCYTPLVSYEVFMFHPSKKVRELAYNKLIELRACNVSKWRNTRELYK